jgi:hypothetical protein
VHAQKVLVRAGGDGEGMPLKARNVRAAQEDVLTGLVVERRLLHAQFEYFRGVLNGLQNDRRLTAAHETNDTFDQVEHARTDEPAPEVRGLQDTTRTVEAENTEEQYEEVVSEPKHFEHWSAHTRYSRSVHEEHDYCN